MLDKMPRILVPLVIVIIAVAALSIYNQYPSLISIPATTTKTEPQPPGVKVLSYPNSVNVGQSIKVIWRVESPETEEINHTAVHYDTQYHPGIFSTTKTPAESNYPNLTPVQKGTIPATFTAQIPTSESGKIYFRAHAIIDGKHYWSEEMEVDVVGEAMTTTKTATVQAGREFTIEADDFGFYINGSKITSIRVAKNENVKITFDVIKERVYFGGLDFRSPKFDTGKVNPGSSKTVNFISDSDFTITSYWPASNQKKADLKVSVA